MEYVAVLEKLGFALAVVTCRAAKVLPSNFWQTVTFNQCVELCEMREADRQLKEVAITAMAGLATTLDNWGKVYQHAPDDSPHKLKALIFHLEHTSSFEATFNLWHEGERLLARVNQTDTAWKSFCEKALLKAVSLAQSFSDYDLLLNFVDEDKKDIFAQKKMEAASTFDQCVKAYSDIRRGEESSSLFDQLFTKMARLAETTENWLQLAYLASMQNLPLHTTFACKCMMRSEKKLEEWVKVWNCSELSVNDKAKAWKKIERLVKTKNEWGQILDWWFCFSDLEKKIIEEKITADCSTFNDWLVVYQDVEKLRKVATEKLLSLAKTFKRLARLTSLDGMDINLRQEVWEKLKLRAVNLNDWLKVYTLSKGNSTEAAGEISKLATTTPDIKKALAVAGRETSLGQTLLTRLGKLASTFKECKKLYQKVEGTAEASKELLTRLIVLSDNLDQAFWVYEKSQRFPEVHEAALKQMKELIAI